MRRKFVGALSIVALLLFVYLQTACNKGIDSPTAPNDPAPPTTSTTTPTPITNVPNAQPTAQPTQAGFAGYIESRDGSGWVTNFPGGVGDARVSICFYPTDANDWQKQGKLAGQTGVLSKDGTTETPIPSPDMRGFCNGVYQGDMAQGLPDGMCPESHTGLSSYITHINNFTIKDKPCTTCETMDIKLSFVKTYEDDFVIKYKFTSNVPGTFTPATGEYTKGDTAREEIVGFVSTEKGCPSSMPVPVPAKKEKPNCSAKNLKLTASPAVDKKNTSPTYRFCFAGSWTNPGTGTFQGNINVPPPVSVGNPFTNLCYDYPQGDTKKTFASMLRVDDGEQQCSFQLDVEVPGREKSCNDVQRTFAEVACVQPATVSPVPTVKKCFSGSFSAGTANVTYGDGSVAETIASSPFNSSHNYAQTSSPQNFTANLNVAYEGLSCPVPVDVAVAPKARTCADMAASCNAVAVNMSDTSAMVHTTCTWTPPPSTGELTVQSTNATVSPGVMHLYPVSRTAADQTINSNLKLNGETCATASAVVQAKPQTCDDLNPKYSEYTGSGEVVPYSNGPTYWKMNQGSDTARKNACENRGGTWLDDYNVPGYGQAHNVCRFPEGNPPGNPGSDMTFLAGGPVGVRVSTSLNLAYGQYTAKLMASTCSQMPAGNSGYSGAITLEDPLPGAMATSTSCQTWIKDTENYNVACGSPQTFSNLGYTCSNCHEGTPYWWIEINPAGAGFPTKSFGYLPRTGF